VDGKYLVSAFNSDDAFDWDEGFNGRGQFWFAIQSPDAGGRIAEMDGAIGDEQGSPYTLPVVANVTYLGDGMNNPGQIAGDGNQALIFRDNSGGTYFNSIFGDYKGQPNAPALTIEDVADPAVEDSRKRLEAGDLKMLNNIWFDFTAGTTPEALFPQDFVRSSPNFANNQIVDPLLRGISRINDGGLDPRLGDGSPARNSANMSLYNDPWFTKVSYKGAFENTNWMLGWTALDQLGYIGATGNELVTRVEDDVNLIPSSIQLEQNYPNPFNPSTIISFSMPDAQQISLKVYDMLGRQVAVLADKQRFSAGKSEISFDASKLASGVYIYQLTGQNISITKRMTLIK
jgi:hypothetical protein